MLFWIGAAGTSFEIVWRQKMSQVFEGYERQYCELSANLSKKITSASFLNGGENISFSDLSTDSSFDNCVSS